MHTLSIFLLWATVAFVPTVQGYTWYNGEQRLNKQKARFANSKADIFFLMDNSGSLWHRTGNGFDDEKRFVSAFLSEIKIAKDATRVAIIRFGDTGTIDINYVTNLNGLNNKCEFNEAFKRVGYTGVMTNMREGFLRVQEILFGAHSTNVRPWREVGKKTNVNKVTFLLTDGGWNVGGNPDDIIARLKRSEVEIFTIGVTNVDKGFLQRTATSSDRYFYYNEFKDFRELATHIRGDPYQPEFETEFVPRSKCTKTCDQNASCGCGLLNGKYSCACHAGYYGSGFVGACKACEPGTYKDFVGKESDSCTKCPNHSSHTQTGSIRISDCVCNKGYEGNPGSGRECTIKKCLQLRVPTDGYTNPTKCSQNYGSECSFHCNQGFELDGEKLLTCTVASNNAGGAFWTAIIPECKRIVCPSYRVPNAVTENGKCDHNDLRAGTKCKYTCIRGYRLVGSSERTCQIDRKWSGQPTECQVVTCPPLNSLTLTTINNRKCIEEPSRFDSKCIFSCPTGYAFNVSRQQTLTRLCKDNGEWDGTYQVCKDILAPSFTNCPMNRIFRYNTTFRLNTSSVSWELPKYEDNSIMHDANHKVTLTEQNNYESPHTFEIGTHHIIYTVTDKEGLKAYCEFFIRVEDHEAPYYTRCPGNIFKETEKSREIIIWDNPLFFDNSGKNPDVTSSRPNTDSFEIGQTMVYYTATDDDGNKNISCQFEVHIKKLDCKGMKLPKDGAVSCYTAVDTDFCRAYCREGFDFGYKPAELYFCGSGKWQTWPPGVKVPWPDCAPRKDPTKVKFGLTMAFFFSGDCNSEEVQLEIKRKFISALRKPGAFPPPFCLIQANCTVENVQVNCGETTAVARRRRRGVQKEIYISADYVAKPNSGSSQADFQHLKREMNDKLYNDAQKRAQSIDWKSTMKLDIVKSPTVKTAEPYCLGTKGAIVGRCDFLQHNCDENNFDSCLCNKETGNIEKCIQCPIGKFYNVMTKKCEICKDGTFQDVEGQFGCKKCLPGTSTFGDDAKNFTTCKEICKPGYYSRTGLAPCTACPYGTYSTDKWSTSCKKCPSGTLTVLPGASRIEDCGMKCAPGTYSSSGVEPCLPCPKGSYQEEEGKMGCLPCQGSRSTYGLGAKSISKCIDINDCESNPCNNGASCKDLKDNYECICKPGFGGRNCEIENNECLSNPCYDNAVCVDKVSGYECVCAKGFTGKNCDEPIPQCPSNACQNGGKCVEMPGSYMCECPDGYAGQFCEKNVDDCSSKPCKNNGLCRDRIDGFVCSCQRGFAGSQCELNIDECASDPCQNGGKCVDQVDGYTCQCVSGYVGKNCQIDFNECAPNPCKNGGKCLDKLNSFECQCAPTFSGRTCETDHSSDFDVSFPTYEIQSFSKTTLRENLHVFTVAFWMRTRDQENAGTPISYSVKRGSYVEENGIVLKDYGNLAIQINNQTGYTGDPLNDGQWHHVAVTWASNNGIWVYYRDGKEIKRASEPLAKGDYVRGGGDLVLGQEQDWEAAETRFTYNPLEAFLGDISQLTLWKKALSAREIYNLAGSCNTADKDAIVVAWGDFAPGLRGTYKKTDKSYACGFDSSLRLFDAVYKARMPSNDHKTLHSVSEDDCAKACMSEASFACRSFDYHVAGRRCYLSKAFRETVSVVTLNNGEYDYYELSCLDALGMESGLIQDSKLSVSSARNSYSGAKEARANRRKIRNVVGMPDSDGGWIPKSSNQYQYLIIDLGKQMKVTGVETQGADGQSYWVTSYRLRYSTDRRSWSTAIQSLTGNTDNKGRKKHQINLQARYVRLEPLTWHHAIGMRVELYGCSLDHEGVPKDLSSIQAAHSGSCSPNPCRNGGSCTRLAYGYACKCPAGYKGISCETAVPCDDPGTPLNGYRSSSNYRSGSTVAFGCNTGYKLSGSNSRTCRNGQWTGTVATCSNVNECSMGICNQHCQDLPGSYRCSCVTGYQLNSDQRTCLDIDECHAQVCSHGCINTQGSFRCTCPSGMKIDSSGTKCEDINECISRKGGCDHNCLNAYRTRQCHCKGGYILQSDGKSCQEIRCPNLLAPRNGKMVIIGDPILGNSAQYTCSEGFKLVGSDQRFCQADGKWSGTQPYCQAVRCVEVGSVDHASRQGNSRGYNSRVTFTCQSTYRLLGTATRTCQKSSIWSNEQPLCVPNYCPALTAPTHGRINGFRTELHATVGVSCEVGYRVKGTSFRTCERSRKWSGSDPTCELVDCGNPGEPSNGYRHGNYYKYNSTINYTCKSRHHLEGASTITCQANGKWSAPKPECLARSCGNPGVPYNGFKHGSSHTYGSTVRYTCQKGYTLVGDRTRTCEESNAKWTGTLPSCQLVNCGVVSVPVNGFRVGNKFTYNEVLRFDCNPGYKLVGSDYRRCQANGAWSGNAASCIRTSCGKFMHGPTGVVESPNFPNAYGNNVYCTWQINVPRGKKVRLDFSEFKTEASKDILYIFDTGRSDPIIQFSGVTYKPYPLTSSGNSIRIRFVSDGQTNSNGFQIRYSQVDCGGMRETPTGSIQSPNYKGPYPPNADCTWLVNLPNKLIGIKFTDFNTQQAYDRLEIYDGANSGSKLIFGRSGPSLPPATYTSRTYMYLRFKSSKGNGRVYRGFRATYEEHLYHVKK